MGATAKRPSTIVAVCRLSGEFAQLTGMEINVKKSAVWATESGHRRELAQTAIISGRPIPCKLEDRTLGAHLAYTRRRAKTTLSRKLPCCLAICERIGASLLPFEVRAMLVATIVMPKAVYGSAATPCSKKDLRTLRAACSKAMWGQANRWRAPEVLHTILAKGHCTDPAQAVHYHVLGTARRVLQRHPEVWAKYVEVFTWRREDPARSERVPTGPVKSLLRAARCCGATWYQNNPGLLRVEIPEGERLISLGDTETGRFLHLVREALRKEQHKALAARRPSFDQLHHGVDRIATCTISRCINGLSKYRWRCLVAGAVPTAKRLHRSRQIDSPLCPCCNEGVEEDLEHVLLHCPAHDHVRYLEFTPEAWAIMPNCLRLHGILPLKLDCVPHGVDPTVEGLAGYVTSVQYALLDILANRQRFCDWSPPRPRWVSARRGLA